MNIIPCGCQLTYGAFLSQILGNVLEVRNNVMHSPDYSLSKGDLKKHLETIECLGHVLEPYIPEMKRLSEEINKVSIQRLTDEGKETFQYHFWCPIQSALGSCSS